MDTQTGQQRTEWYFEVYVSGDAYGTSVLSRGDKGRYKKPTLSVDGVPAKNNDRIGPAATGIVPLRLPPRRVLR